MTPDLQRSLHVIETHAMVHMAGDVAEEVFVSEISSSPFEERMRYVAAAHEAGHVVAGQMLGKRPYRATIRPEGQSGGYVDFSPIPDRKLPFRTDRQLMNLDIRALYIGYDIRGWKAMRRKLREMRAEVRRMLDENRHIADAVRRALLDRQSLNADQIDQIIQAEHLCMAECEAVQ
jgi:ATP-dependent Zn protease